MEALSEAHPVPEIPDICVEVFKKICKKLRFTYSPDLFANPSLQAFYSKLEELVFDDDELEILKDTTLPDIERQDSQIGEFLPSIEPNFGTVISLCLQLPNGLKDY